MTAQDQVPIPLQHPRLHLPVRAQRLLHFRHPALDHIGGILHDVATRHQGRTAHSWSAVHNGLLHVPLDGLHHRCLEEEMVKIQMEKSKTRLVFPNHNHHLNHHTFKNFLLDYSYVTNPEYFQQ